MLFGGSAGRVRVQGWGKGIFSLFMRTELSEIYDFHLGFWKWRLGGRILFCVWMVERPFGAEGSDDYFFSWGVSLQPLAFGNREMEMYVFSFPNLMSQTEKEWALPSSHCLKTGWESFRCGSTLREKWLVPCDAPDCYCVCVRGQGSFWMCVCLCTFLALSWYGIYLVQHIQPFP